MKSEELTFVIQGSYIAGAVFGTRKLIKSINTLYPESPIILSTWLDGLYINTDGLKNLTVIKNLDPGELITKNRYLKNINRMITSTGNGIGAVNTKYAAKIRSDFYLTRKLCLNPKNLNEIENGKILMCMARGHYPLLPYFMSDWFNLGRTDKMKKLWQVKLISNGDLAPNPIKKNSIYTTTDAIHNQDFYYHSEQWVAYNYISKIENIENIERYETFTGLILSYLKMEKYFCVETRWNIGLRSEKHLVTKKLGDLGFYCLLSGTAPIMYKSTILAIAISSYIILLKSYKRIKN